MKMEERTFEEIFKNDVVKAFIKSENLKTQYLSIEQEYQRLENKLSTVRTYADRQEIEEKLEHVKAELKQHLKAHGKPTDFIIDSAVSKAAKQAGSKELKEAQKALDISVGEMLSLLNQAAAQYEDVLEKQLAAQKIIVRMNYLKNIETDIRNVKMIKTLIYSAGDYTTPGTLNYDNTPQYFGEKLIAMLSDKYNKEKIYSEGLQNV